MFDEEWSETRRLKFMVTVAFVCVGLVAAILGVTWPYGHWVALVVGGGMLLQVRSELRALGAGDGGPGGGMVEQRRQQLRSRRVILALVVVAGVCGAVVQLGHLYR